MRPVPKGFEQQLAPGTAFDGELCCYPSTEPLRILVRRLGNMHALEARAAAPSILGTLLDTYSGALAFQPFLERDPVLREGLVPDALRHAEQTRATAREVVAHVVEDLERKLASPMRQAVSGSLNRAVRICVPATRTLTGCARSAPTCVGSRTTAP
jgi:hypothetical protein